MVGFGARTRADKLDYHALDNVRIATGSRFRTQVVPTEVSMNSQENTLDQVDFSYYAEPVVSRLNFQRGPVLGGTNVTVTGSSFRGGSVYRCRFGGEPSEVYSTYPVEQAALQRAEQERDRRSLRRPPSPPLRL